MADQATEEGLSLHVTGNPRFELGEGALRRLATERAKALRSSLGPYVLVNTSFSFANSARSAPRVLDKLRADRGGEAARHAWQRSMRALVQMLDIIRALREHRSELTIVVRPHPGESIAFYESYFADDSKVVVRREDAVLPWIAGAEAILCDNCTTSVEAGLLGVPALQPPPRPGTATSAHILSHFCHQSESIAELLSRLDAVLEGRLSPVPLPLDEGLGELLHNLRDPEATPLDDVLAQALAATPCVDERTLKRTLLHLRPRLVLRGEAGRLAGGLLALGAERREWREYARGKFPGFRIDDLRERMSVLNRSASRPLRVDLFSSELVRLVPED